MNDLFLLKVILSFFVGALYTLIATVSADKLGSKIGGLISGLPSTVLFGLFFIGWTQTPQAAAEATLLIPAVIGVACVFLITYLTVVVRNVWLALLAAFVIWSGAALALTISPIENFLVSLGIFGLLYITTYFIVTRLMNIPSVKGKKISYSPKLILIRGALAGSVVALSVVIAKTGGPILGGMISAFPAMFSSTLLITYYAHGADFSANVAKNSLFAWISTTIFVVAMRYTMEPFGIVLGSIISLIICYISAYLLYTLKIKKHA